MDKDLKEIVDKCIDICEKRGMRRADSYLDEDIAYEDFIRLAMYFNCNTCSQKILKNILDYKKNKIKPLTQQEFEIVKMICENKGIEICDVFIDKFKEFPYLTIDKKKTGISGYIYNVYEKEYESKEEYEVISFNKFLKIASKRKPIIKLQLTDDYEAVVKEGYVQVGCQEISFDKVKELYELIKDK